jgi:S1-C subfamily serine protease
MFLHAVKLPLMVRLACSGAVSGRILASLATALVAFACATTQAVATDSPISGCIGAAVSANGSQVVISAVGPAGQAAGLRQGDVVVSYNGARIANVREFERLVLDTPPGSAATLEVMRAGRPVMIDLRVTEVPTEDRA